MIYTKMFSLYFICKEVKNKQKNLKLQIIDLLLICKREKTKYRSR